MPLLAPEWAFWGLIVLLVLAAMQDAAQLKISNYLVGAVLVLAVVAAVVAGPRIGLWQNGLVFAIALTIGTFLFGRGMLGGGDVKLFAATALWFDLSGALRLLVLTAIAGGLLAILIIVLRTLPVPDAIRSRVRTLQPKAGIPYGIAIALGAIWASLTLAGGAALTPGQ